MKIKFYKTEHFLYRQWDRGIEDDTLDKIICNIKNRSKTKSFIIAGSTFLRKIGINVNKKTNLIIISQGKALLTLFFVDDLYNYLKSLKGNINSTIL